MDLPPPFADNSRKEKLILGFINDNLLKTSNIDCISILSDFRNFNLAGVLKNKSLTSTHVPLFNDVGINSIILSFSTNISQASSDLSILDLIFNLPEQPIDGKASPLNP